MHLALPIVPLEPSLGSFSSVLKQLLRSAHMVLFPGRLGNVHGCHIQLALTSDASRALRPGSALGPAPLPGSRGEANHQRGEGEAKGAREGWLATAPAPEFLRLCDGTSANRFVVQDTAQFIRQFLRGLVTA